MIAIRHPETCAHGVPLRREDRCDHCELLWLEECVARTEPQLAKRRKRIAFLKLRIASQLCGDA